MKKLFLALVLLIASSAWATDYYYSDCQPGAILDCKAGSNANPGTSAQAPKQTPIVMPALLPGDRMLFARGGSWIETSIVIGSNQTPTNPAVIEAYSPDWCTQACLNTKPKLKAKIGNPVIGFSNGGVNAVHKDGLTIRNLEIYGEPMTGINDQSGIYVNNDANHVLIENVYVHDLVFGFLCFGYTNQPGATDGSSDYITIRNSRFEHNSAEGIAAFGHAPSCNHMLIENNTLDGNGYARAVYDHSIYLSNSNDLIIRGNTITNNSHAAGGGCASVAMVFHNTMRRVLIENNTIQESVGALGGCYGISPSTAANNTSVDDLADFIIRGNRIINVGGVGIAQIGCMHCLIENNMVVWTQNSGFDRIGIAAQATIAGTDPDVLGGLATVRNNAVYIAGANRDSRAYEVTETGSGHVVVSNAAYFDAASSPLATCFKYGSKIAADFAAADYNACYGVNGAILNNKGAEFDAHSIRADPLVGAVPSGTNGWLIRFKPGSPTVNAGHPTLSAATDFNGRLRDAHPDIGALELAVMPDAVLQLMLLE